MPFNPLGTSSAETMPDDVYITSKYITVVASYNTLSYVIQSKFIEHLVTLV